MYINSIKHHDGDLAEKIKDLSLNHFILYEIFLFYLARNKGSFNLESDEFQKIYLLLKKKSRIELKDVIPYLMTLAQLGAWDYKKESNTIVNKQLISLSSKFSKGGKKGQESKKKTLEAVDREDFIIEELPNVTSVKIGEHKSNSDLVNKLMEFNQQGNHNGFRVAIDYERLVTKIRPETINFYLDNVELFKKASSLDNGNLPAFRNGYFRVFNEFRKAITNNIDLKPELPEWVKINSSISVPVIEEKPKLLDNYRKYTFYSPLNGEFTWVSFLRSFLSTRMSTPPFIKQFCNIHTKEEWQENFNHWFYESNISGLKESFISELKDFSIDSMFESYEDLKLRKGAK